MNIIVALAVGGVAGWLAGLIMKSKGGGIIFNIILGIVGGFIGNWLFGLLDISQGSGIVGSIVTANVGAIFLLFLARLLTKKSN